MHALSTQENTDRLSIEAENLGPESLGMENFVREESAFKAVDAPRYDPLQRYLTEIGKYRLLRPEEEHELALRVGRSGDEESIQILVTSNLRLVVKIAKGYQRVWMQNLLDLIQEGNLGLMQAAKKFDAQRKVKFSYYASFWIKAYILKFIMDNWRLVRVGTTQGQRKLFFRLKKEKEKLIAMGFEPRPKLLADRIGVSEREVVDMDQRYEGWDVSLDARLKEDSDTERSEVFPSEAELTDEKVAKKQMDFLLHNKLSLFKRTLTPRELEIFESRIFTENPVVLQDLGTRYGISRERVRQIERLILEKIRKFFKKEIPDFEVYREAQAA